MRRLYRLFFFLCLLSGLKQEIHAQSFCGTDEVHRYLLRTNPEYKKAIELQNAQWQRYSKETSKVANRLAMAEGEVLEIPVVIHVIHTGGTVGTTNNPSDDDLIAWIADLNAIFAANYNSGPGGINTDGSVSIPVLFKLARRTPDCQATNGINRVDGSILSEFTEWGVFYGGGEKHGPSDAEVKALSRWPSESYMNIWLVARINGAGGYATLPGTSSPEVDGIVVVNTEVTILAHEVGHFLMLYHTFQGSQDGICPPNNDCTIDGDQVCDTEPHYSQGCNDGIGTGNSGINPCTNQLWGLVGKNFMNYSPCGGMFTAGQRDRMLYALEELRGNLLTSLGYQPPGIDPVIPSPIVACGPAGIVNPGEQIGPRNIILADMKVVTQGNFGDYSAYYIDHTIPSCHQKMPVAHLKAGSIDTITVTTGPSRENVRGWIDFNNDGNFQPSELIIRSDGTAAPQTHTASFNVPVNDIVTCTALRMRIMSDVAENNQAPLEPCSSLLYGQAEDFSVIVLDPVPSVPSVSISASQNGICEGESVTFSATPVNGGTNPTYRWSLNGNNVGTNRTYSTNALSNGDVVSCVMTSSNLCIATPTATSNSITISTTTSVAPSINILANAVNGSICTGTSVTFTATSTNGGTSPTYQWKVGNTSVGTNSATYSTTNLTNGAVVTCTLASNASCTNVSTVTSEGVTISVSAPPLATVAAAGPLSFCAGKNVLLKAIPGTGYTYQWKKAGVDIDNATTSNYTATTAGAYSVVVTNATGCSATSSLISVTVNPVPLTTVAAASALTFCEGKTVQLKAIAGAGYTYQWKRGATDIVGATLSNYTASATGYYTVIVKNATGCSATSAALAVVVKPLPLSTITTAGPTTFCFGKNVLLKANTGTNYTYQWKRAATIIPGAVQSTYAATDPGFYSVIVTNASGCSVTSNALAVTVNPIPVATITPSGPLTFCVGQSVVLRGNTGTNYTYQWRKAGVNITGATGVNYTATASGLYTVFVINAAGCAVTSAAVTVTVNNAPLANVAASGTTTFCAGKNVLLKAITGTGYTYQWKKNSINIAGETTSNYTATAAGNYFVVVTNATGCSTTSTIVNVAVTPAPLATVAVAGPTTFCEGKTVLLKAITGTGYIYQWKKNGVNIPAQTQSNFTATAAGVYTVGVTNAEGCSTLSTGISVNVTPAPAAIVTANGPLTFPPGGNVILKVPAATGNIYQWKREGVNITGATTESYIATASGSYTVTVTNADGCQAISQPTVVTVTQTRPITKGYVEESEKITVYPNPLYRNDYVNIDWNISAAGKAIFVTVYDNTGRIINSQRLRPGDSKLKITGASGIYLVELRWGMDKRKTFRVIKIE